MLLWLLVILVLKISITHYSLFLQLLLLVFIHPSNILEIYCPPKLLQLSLLMFLTISKPPKTLHIYSPYFLWEQKMQVKLERWTWKYSMWNIIRSDYLYVKKNLRRSKSLGWYGPDGNQHQFFWFLFSRKKQIQVIKC